MIGSGEEHDHFQSQYEATMSGYLVPPEFQMEMELQVRYGHHRMLWFAEEFVRAHEGPGWFLRAAITVSWKRFRSWVGYTFLGWIRILDD